jgi:hypothetical protein
MKTKIDSPSKLVGSKVIRGTFLLNKCSSKHRYARFFAAWPLLKLIAVKVTKQERVL